jgi:hypothetical protein
VRAVPEWLYSPVAGRMERWMDRTSNPLGLIMLAVHSALRPTS